MTLRRVFVQADNCFVFKPMIPGYGDKRYVRWNLGMMIDVALTILALLTAGIMATGSRCLEE